MKQTKKLLSLALAITLVLSCWGAAPVALADENTSGDAASPLEVSVSAVSQLPGSGTADDPLRIYSGQNLYDFAQCFNASQLPVGLPTGTNLHLSLMNDIDLSAFGNWTPIGTTGTPFKGTFKSNGAENGNTYTIAGLTIKTTPAQQTNYGLFGSTDEASLKNLNVSASLNLSTVDVQNAIFVGALVGFASGGSITNCSTSGTIALSTGGDDADAGGLAGQSSALISNSFSTCSVKSSGRDFVYSGGLVGLSSESITGSYSTGNVSSFGSSATVFSGGLVGYSGASIVNSYATGTVHATGTSSYAGGLVGNSNNVIKDSVALGLEVSGATNAGRITGENNGTLTNSYAWKAMLVNGAVKSPDNLNGADATYGDSTATDLATETFWGTTIPFVTNPWTYTTSQTPSAVPVLATTSITQDTKLPVWITKLQQDTSTYYIYTTQDLAELARLVGAGETFENKTVLVMNDIDLSAFDNWTPIGTETNPFKGSFQSNPANNTTYTITGLTINATPASVNKHYGLFGYMSNATIKNVAVDATIDVSSDTSDVYAGALVGFAASGIIEGCVTSGAISLSSTSNTSYAGGLAGYVAESSTVAKSSSSSNVKSSGDNAVFAGGLIGDSAATIKSSYSSGNTEANTTTKDSFAGGLTGRTSAPIADSYSTGNTSAQAKNQDAHAGGLVGHSLLWGVVEKCFTTGEVTTVQSPLSYAGGIVGLAQANISNSIALGSKISGGYSSGGPWRIGRIAGQADIIVMKDNYAWKNMLVNGSTSSGVVNDNNGANATCGDATNTDLATETFWSTTAGGFTISPWVYETRTTKPYGIPLLKDVGGTQNPNLPSWISGLPQDDEDNYLIYTAQDLAQFANLVNVGYSFEGETVLIMNDIDLSHFDKWTPIGTATKPFKGIFQSNPTSGTTYAITGVHITNTPLRITFYGLFGALDHASIKNVAVDASVNVSGADSHIYAGALAGAAITTTIEGCSSSGTIAISAPGVFVYAGGLVGYSAGSAAPTGFVKNSSASSAVRASGGSNVYAGGLVGSSTRSILNCYSTGSTTAETTGGSCQASAGGIAGRSSNALSDCYATGAVNAVSRANMAYVYAGGLVGNLSGVGDFTGSITNSYATGNVNAQSQASSKKTSAGGLVGDSAGSIKNSVALGQSVVAADGSNSQAGRIFGSSNGSSNNTFAWEGMLINNAIIPDSDGEVGHNKKHGASITGTTAFSGTTFWSAAATDGPAFDSTTWALSTNHLPLLTAPRGKEHTPLHLMSFPSNDTAITLHADKSSFVKSTGTATVTLTAEGTFKSLAPSTLEWSGGLSRAVTTTPIATGNYTAAAKINLSQAATHIFTATVAYWPFVSSQAKVKVNGTLEEAGASVKINGTPKYGETLTAVFSDTVSPNDPAENITYQWFVDGVSISGATGTTLTLDNPAYVGKTISVEARATNYSDPATDADVVLKKDYEGTVLDPVLDSKTTSSIKLVAVKNYEYQILPKGSNVALLLETNWQTSPEFTELDAGEYDLYQRVASTETTSASPASGPLTVTLETNPPGPKDPKTDPSSPKTGDALPVIPLAILAVLFASLTIVAYRKR